MDLAVELVARPDISRDPCNPWLNVRLSVRGWSSCTRRTTARMRRRIRSRSSGGTRRRRTRRSSGSARRRWRSGAWRACSTRSRRSRACSGRSRRRSCGGSIRRRRIPELRAMVHRWTRGVDIVALLWILRQMIDRSGSIEGFFREGYDPAAIGHRRRARQLLAPGDGARSAGGLRAARSGARRASATSFRARRRAAAASG